jgi:hypothetical protein
VQSGKLLGPFSRAETRISVFRPTPTNSIVSDNRREISSGNEGPIFRVKTESVSVWCFSEFERASDEVFSNREKTFPIFSVEYGVPNDGKCLLQIVTHG